MPRGPTLLIAACPILGPLRLRPVLAWHLGFARGRSETRSRIASQVRLIPASCGSSAEHGHESLLTNLLDHRHDGPDGGLWLVKLDAVPAPASEQLLAAG